MHSNELISIIIPTYNREDVIGRAIESALCQTYKNIEIIVVDDGSTDATLQKLKTYQNKFITIICQRNSGPSKARNYGASFAKGKYLAFLDSDDIWFPEKLEKQIRLIETAGPKVMCCLCNSIIKYKTNTEILSFSLAPLEVSYDYGLWNNVAEVLSTRSVVFTQASLINKTAFQKVGGFDNHLSLMEDWDLSLRLSLVGKWVYIKEPLMVYHRDREDSLSFNAASNIENLNKAILRACENALASEITLPDNAKKELHKKIKNAKRRIFIVQEAYSNPVKGLYFLSLLFYEKVRMIIIRRLYKKIRGLLPIVQDRPLYLASD